MSKAAKRGRAKPDAESAAATPDKFALYEAAVQDTARMVRFVRAVHGAKPRVLREDFCGPGGLCRAWVRLVKSGTAIAVDFDQEPLSRARAAGVTLVCADVMDANQRADVIAAFNFPVGYWHTRKALVEYFARSRERLKRGGVLMCDMFGGPGAFAVRTQRVRVPMPPASGARGEFLYVWRQIENDPRSGRVRCAIDFRVGAKGWIRDAFTYDWRLWSLPELREAMIEAGFRGVEFHDTMGDAVDQDGNLYVRAMDERDAASMLKQRDWVVYAVGRK
jgi:hypothetical protein